MQDFWHKLIPPVFGFFGAIVMMSYLSPLPTRLWGIALTAGPALAYLASDHIVRYLINQLSWLPTDEISMLKLGGLVGAAVGLMAIHIVGAAATWGRRVAADPLNPRGKK